MGTVPRDNATVFVLDDDSSMLRATARGLKTAGYQVEAFGSPDQFLARPLYNGVGCLVVDLRMAGMNGLEVQYAVKRAGSTLPVIFLSGYGDVPTTVKAMQAGAVDFLTRPYSLEQLLRAVSLAVEKHREGLLTSLETTQMRRKLRLLTARERDVCRLVVQGLLNKQIAGDLGAAEGTIKIHRRRVMQKLGVDSVAELVRLVDRAGPL
jgi:FixJ family two-component response regulator